MAKKDPEVAKNRNYQILDVETAKKIALVWLENFDLGNVVSFGLPEIDDRYHIWRVPLLNKLNSIHIGEVVIDAYTSLINKEKSTSKEVLEARILGRNGEMSKPKKRKSSEKYKLSTLRNIIAQGDSEEILQDLPAGSVDLVFTSPPYYNARPEYTDYVTYEEYLLKLRKIIQNTHRVLAEGRFFVINIAPILIRRANRNQSSKRIAVPFDVHRIFIEEGFDFMEDIIWVKPEGAGWATGRGRRFAADRNPLQYKAVPITEYVLVYRKHTDKLIDWNIRHHPKSELVKESRIEDDYEKTNIWHIGPHHGKEHPAMFPDELAEKVIKYYSFIEDVVLDPFAGSGTVGRVAIKNGRRFVLIEKEEKYINHIRTESKKWLGKNAKDILTINCLPINTHDMIV